LNGILGFAKLVLKNGENPNKRARYVSLICRSGERMHSTVKELVEISKIEAGQLKTNKNIVDIREQTNYLYNLFHREANDKGLKLIFNNGNHYSNTIITDKEKSCAILMNIIKNAIKYTDTGTIKFDSSSTENEIFYRIEDTGIGIPKDRQKAVFERFVQADIMDKDAREGVGLGLAISKAYIELLNGTIKMESEEGKGTCVKINIPIEREK